MTELPEDYEPFDELLVCSNTLLGGGHVVTINGYPIFLIGKGILPLVWLSVPVDVDSSRWKYIVEKSVSRNKLVETRPSKLKRQVKIFFAGRDILHVAKISDVSASVELVDFTWIGYDVKGDRDGLRVGGTNLSRNVFQNVNAMIAVETEKGKYEGKELATAAPVRAP